MTPIRYHRILLKISGEMLAGSQSYGIHPEILTNLAKEIAEVVRMEVEVALVIGGGNIFRGIAASASGMERASADYMGMLGTVINALAVQDLLEHKGVDNRVLTAIRMDEIAEPYIRRRALRHMERGRVVLFAGGTGNPYFSTDTAAVLRAIEMESDVVIKATKVEGVFTADPEHDSSAEFIPKISFQEVMARELAVMDAAAVSLCKENDLPIIVLDLQEQGAVAAAIRGEPVGTLVS